MSAGVVVAVLLAAFLVAGQTVASLLERQWRRKREDAPPRWKHIVDRECLPDVWWYADCAAVGRDKDGWWAEIDHPRYPTQFTRHATKAEAMARVESDLEEVDLSAHAS